MSTSRIPSAVFLSLVLALPAPSAAAVRGYVERPWTPTTCLQGSHFITDPCTGLLMLLDERGATDLDPYVCTYVVVDGPDVGVECQVIASSSVVPSQTNCPILFGHTWMGQGTPTRIYWDHVTCARSYDVVRGDLASVIVTPSRIDLGPVGCYANDVPQPDWWSVSVPGDASDPALGESFFYLVRANGLPFGDTTYGQSSDGKERIPASGDCPL